MPRRRGKKPERRLQGGWLNLQKGIPKSIICKEILAALVKSYHSWVKRYCLRVKSYRFWGKIPKNKKILLKPNILGHFGGVRSKAATTNPIIIKAIAK